MRKRSLAVFLALQVNGRSSSVMLKGQRSRLCLVGKSHVALAFAAQAKELKDNNATEQTTRDKKDREIIFKDLKSEREPWALRIPTGIPSEIKEGELVLGHRYRPPPKVGKRPFA